MQIKTNHRKTEEVEKEPAKDLDLELPSAPEEDVHEDEFEDTLEEDLDDLEGPTDEDIMNVENGVEGDED